MENLCLGSFPRPLLQYSDAVGFLCTVTLGDRSIFSKRKALPLVSSLCGGFVRIHPSGQSDVSSGHDPVSFAVQDRISVLA